MSAECDLPCREHYYPRQEFNTGAAGCHLQQPAMKCSEEIVVERKRWCTRSGGFGSISQLRTCWCSDLAAPFPPHFFSGEPFRDNFSTGPQWPPTQRASQPAVITPCKCHLVLLIWPVSYRFNWFAVYHPEHTHLWCPEEGRGPGWGSSVHSFIWKFPFFCFFFLCPLLI